MVRVWKDPFGKGALSLILILTCGCAFFADCWGSESLRMKKVSGLVESNELNEVPSDSVSNSQQSSDGNEKEVLSSLPFKRFWTVTFGQLASQYPEKDKVPPPVPEAILPKSDKVNYFL